MNHKRFIILAVTLLIASLVYGQQKAIFDDFKLQDYITGDWNIEKTTHVYSKESPTTAEKKVITGQLNFTTNASPLEETKDIEDSTFTLASIFTQAKGASAAIDPLLESSEDESEEEGSESGHEEEEEEVKFDIADATTGTLTLNKTSYELNFVQLQTGAVGSVSPQLKFFFVNKNQFLAIVTSKQEDGSVVEQVWTGERILNNNQPSFFQKYGPSLMIGLFIFGSKLFQRQAPAAPAAPAAQ